MFLSSFTFFFIFLNIFHQFLQVSSSQSSPQSSSSSSSSAVKPIAIVFPQFHQIPENDKFWGEGFTEWTFLKPMPRYVHNVAMRKPHPDIGYYNLLDYSHRKYMRQMADHFGIYGFCFYHFWFKDRPVMYKPAQLILTDGEPNKPFFFCWANEAWTSRWDGGRDFILIDQNYTDDAGNRAHFMHLLKFFKHPNYIRIDDRPVFAVYRVEKHDEAPLRDIFRLWDKLAVENGLKGIHYSRFFGPFDNTNIIPDVFKSYIEFEPGYSMGSARIPTKPSIFPDDKFDESLFRLNNPDLDVPSINATKHYLQEGEYERAVRVSQFKVYNKTTIWRNIEKRKFKEPVPVFRGTFVNWNNAPRRNFTNKNYRDYPTYITPPGVDGFEDNLKKVVELVERDAKPPKRGLITKSTTSSNPSKYMFLTAWNEWNEQSTFEPNDIDGYDALSIVKKVVKTPGSSGKSIIHVSHKGGGTERYIRDLIKLFPEYIHSYPELHEIPSKPPSNCILLHIHSAMIGPTSPGWNLLNIMKEYRDAGVNIIVTVHDYQWFFPDNPNPTLRFLNRQFPTLERVQNIHKMFLLANQIIFPSEFLREYYENTILDHYLHPNGHSGSSRGNNKSIVNNHHNNHNNNNHNNNNNQVKQSSVWNHSVAVLHPDVLIDHSYINIPAIIDRTIHIAFVGLFIRMKGSLLFLNLSQKLTEVISASGEKIRVQYHVFGVVSSDLNCKYSDCHEVPFQQSDYPNIIFHGGYVDSQINNLLITHNIHALIYLSVVPETYCYALTTGINTGLPIIYSNIPAFKERLSPSLSVKYHPVNTNQELVSVTNACAQFILLNPGYKNRYYSITKNLQPSKWYISNYPINENKF